MGDFSENLGLFSIFAAAFLLQDGVAGKIVAPWLPLLLLAFSSVSWNLVTLSSEARRCWSQMLLRMSLEAHGTNWNCETSSHTWRLQSGTWYTIPKPTPTAWRHSILRIASWNSILPNVTGVLVICQVCVGRALPHQYQPVINLCFLALYSTCWHRRWHRRFGWFSLVEPVGSSTCWREKPPS